MNTETKDQPKKQRKRRQASEADTTRRRIEANIKETQILLTVSQLQKQLGEWFEVAPQDMHEGFDKRLRRQIGSLID